MNIISRIQLVAAGVFIALVLVVCCYVVTPVLKQIGHSTNVIYSVYSKKNTKRLVELKSENDRLLKSKEGVDQLSEDENSSSRWYDYLQKRLKKYSIQTNRINSTGIQQSGKFGVEDFSFSCTSDYRNIARFVNEVEKSQFVCSVKNVHLLSKSLLDNKLDIEITISFYQKDL